MKTHCYPIQKAELMEPYLRTKELLKIENIKGPSAKKEKTEIVTFFSTRKQSKEVPFIELSSIKKNMSKTIVRGKNIRKLISEGDSPGKQSKWGSKQQPPVHETMNTSQSRVAIIKRAHSPYEVAQTIYGTLMNQYIENNRHSHHTQQAKILVTKNAQL
jgi:hypothetical protein